MNSTKYEKAIDPFRISGILLILSVILFFLTGCTESKTDHKQVKLEPGQVKQIKIGQTTQVEVESLLGKPTFSAKSHGQTELYYSKFQVEQRHMVVNESAIPGMGIVPFIVVDATAETLFDKSRMTVNEVTIFIGKDGKVADIRQLTGDGHSTGAFVKDDYPHPDITKADQIQPGVTTREQVNTLLGAPPSMAMSQANNNSQFALWICETGQLSQLGVIFRQDGTVDEVKKYFKGDRWFPKRVNADKVAQIKERQSTHQAAESVLGRPLTISRNVQGIFYTYYIQVGENKEEVYIEYDSSGVITRLIRKPQPQQ